MHLGTHITGATTITCLQYVAGLCLPSHDVRRSCAAGWYLLFSVCWFWQRKGLDSAWGLADIDWGWVDVITAAISLMPVCASACSCKLTLSPGTCLLLGVRFLLILTERVMCEIQWLSCTWCWSPLTHSHTARGQSARLCVMHPPVSTLILHIHMSLF